MIKVAVAGGFDPLRPAHIAHMRKAKKLGTYLIVFLNPDKDMIRKKGYCFMPWNERAYIIDCLPFVDEVVQVIDNDGTVAETIKKYKPKVFAKGGDRVPSNMPKNEIEACETISCRLEYGIGDHEGSSSTLVSNACLGYLKRVNIDNLLSIYKNEKDKYLGFHHFLEKELKR